MILKNSKLLECFNLSVTCCAMVVVNEEGVGCLLVRLSRILECKAYPDAVIWSLQAKIQILLLLVVGIDKPV